MTLVELRPITQADVDALRERSCVRKKAYGQKQAREVARALGLVPYPCRWCAQADVFGRPWHIGHPMSMEGLEHLARVLRAIANGEVEG